MISKALEKFLAEKAVRNPADGTYYIITDDPEQHARALKELAWQIEHPKGCEKRKLKKVRGKWIFQ